MTTPEAKSPGLSTLRWDFRRAGLDGAAFSHDRRYRYQLWRTWDPAKPRMAWVMLNPSIADADVPDPTITRCISFAVREGCGAIEVLNLYGLRATSPRNLLDAEDPEGPVNAAVWRQLLGQHRGPVVAAWGASRPPTGPISRALLDTDTSGWLCLGRTKAGAPRHPLYVRGDTAMELL